MLKTHNLWINAIQFLAPVLGILWLHWLFQIQVARWDYLTIGAAAIIASNLWIKKYQRGKRKK